MKKFILALGISFFLIFCNSIYGQNYIDMPKTVQQQMDYNKREGKSTFSDIIVEFNVQLDNVKKVDIQRLTNLFNDDKQVKTFSFSEKGSKLTLFADPTYSIKDIKNQINSTSIKIVKYSTLYEVSK